MVLGLVSAVPLLARYRTQAELNEAAAREALEEVLKKKKKNKAKAEKAQTRAEKRAEAKRRRQKVHKIGEDDGAERSAQAAADRYSFLNHYSELGVEARFLRLFALFRFAPCSSFLSSDSFHIYTY